MAWDESESKLTIVFAKIFKNVLAKIFKNLFAKVFKNVFAKIFKNVFAKIIKNVFAKIIKNVFTKTINVSFVPIVDHSRASASAAWYKPPLVLLLGDRWVIPVFICQNLSEVDYE